MREALGTIETLIDPRTGPEPDPLRPCPLGASHSPTPPQPRTPTMSARIIQVDSFTNRPFAGNPAAVCLLDAPRPESWMQHVAAEMNLSETAFVHPLEAGPRVPAPLVHPERGGRPLRPRHAGGGPRPLGGGPGRRDEAPRSSRPGAAGSPPRRRGDWIELDFPAEPAECRDQRPARARLDRRGPEQLRSSRRAATASTSWSSSPTSRPCGTSSRTSALVGVVPGPRGHRHEPGLVARVRFRLPLLRAPGRRRRGSRSAARPTAASAPSGRRSWAATS